MRIKLDKLKSLGINTVFFQVKPDGTALWPSKILPWSDTLTGKIGQDPGYDPLQFMLDEAHKRGMRVHAWFNPYRVSTNIKPSTVAELNSTLPLHPSSVFVLHRDWVRTAGDRFVLDPGIPDARDWITRRLSAAIRSMACSSMTTSIPRRRVLRLMTARRSENMVRDLRRRPTGGGIIRSS